jgi:predicted nucleic acid-binding Zn ribbon protein
MPTYEYECGKCRGTFEVEQKISEPPLTKCARVGRLYVGNGFVDTSCNGELRRLISSPAAFVLKGKGWFKDGY